MSDEIQITILGITVVFLGLILTSLLIYSFSFIQKYEDYKNKKKQKLTDKAISKVQANIIIPPDIIAILSTILEIELRLKISLDDSKFTFNQK
jgi:Na+-transporting methylmalonyl-CoA/oxaloacetate decarboxylase gamma subunit